ncbi:hypothetical protein TNCV_5034331 [Trichonephila clavipes]|nr:hypothetical protein TNCV_5034331 [Trichonephila clavipes]
MVALWCHRDSKSRHAGSSVAQWLELMTRRLFGAAGTRTHDTPSSVPQRLELTTRRLFGAREARNHDTPAIQWHRDSK